VGRRHLAVAIASLALVPTASGAGGTVPWRELGRGSSPAAPGAPLGYVALTRAETHPFDSAVGASGRARLAKVDFSRDAVVAVLGAFGCTDHRVFVSSLSQRGSTVVVTLVRQPLAPGFVECEAIFGTWRLLTVTRTALRGNVETRARVVLRAASIGFRLVASGATQPTGSQSPVGYLAAGAVGERPWLRRLSPADRAAAQHVDFRNRVVAAVFLDGLPCGSGIRVAALTRTTRTLLVGVSYERPRPGVATCVRLSIPYLVLSIDRATLGGPLPVRVEVQANARS
jgi:hypothetical protein